MKKWIDSNYHYMVPKFDETSKVEPILSSFIADVKLGADCATPVILAPVSIVSLINFYTETEWSTYRTALAIDKAVKDRVDALTEKDFAREELFEVSKQKSNE